MTTGKGTVLAGARPASSPTFIAVRPSSLRSGTFGAYKLACRGAVYDHVYSVNMVPRHAWPGVYAALTTAGFAVTLSPVARQWLEEASATSDALSNAATDRIRDLQVELTEAGRPLRSYQLAGVNWLVEQRAAFLLDDMGLGKTIQALAAIPAGVGVIIECPASLRFIWRDEVARWRTDLAVIVSPTEDDPFWPSPNSVYIVSDHWIKTRVQTQPWPSPPTRLYLISDEAHRFKGKLDRKSLSEAPKSVSQRATAMQALCADIRQYDGWTLAMTGTPLMNDAPELYSLFLVFGAARKAFGSWSEYKSLWHTKRGRFHEVIWGDPKPELANRVKIVSLRRTRAEVLPELPGKTYELIPCEAGKQLSKRMDETYRSIKDDLDEWEQSTHVIPPMSISEHTALWKEMARTKIADMLAWVERTRDDGPLVVFAMHLAPIEELAKLKRWAIITGDVTPLRRRDAVSDFQQNKLDGIAATIKSGGTGLTLTRSHRVLFVELAFCPPDNWQAEDRVCRFGQTEPAIISRLIMDHPLERRLDEIITIKTRKFRGAIQATSGFTE